MNKQRNDNLFSPFNLSHFKKWMNHQHDTKSETNIVGLKVESKISFKKLISRIESEDDNLEEIAKDFKKNGGVITDMNENNILIEVESGCFTIHKMYVKKKN
jgi:translation initiation factor 1 (eIF-1/SUI1)